MCLWACTLISKLISNFSEVNHTSKMVKQNNKKPKPTTNQKKKSPGTQRPRTCQLQPQLCTLTLDQGGSCTPGPGDAFSHPEHTPCKTHPEITSCLET